MHAKIYPVALIAMIVINGFLVFTLLSGRKNNLPDRHGKNKPMLMHEISEKLMLDELQKEKYSALALAHGDALDKIGNNERELIRTYFNFLNDDVPILADQKIILNQLEAIESEKIKITYKHFEEVKKICTPKQLVHFDSIVEDIIRVLTKKNRKIPPPPRD